MIDKFRVSVGHVEVPQRAKDLMREVLETGDLTYGPMLKKFEKDFALMHGCKYAVAVNSGTSALECALAACTEKYGWQPGDEIIVPALTFVATINMVVRMGFKPVFVDVDLGMDLRSRLGCGLRHQKLQR